MRNTKGFTMIEIIIALSVLALLSASIALPAVIKNLENAKAKICSENRRVIEHAEQRFLLEAYRHSKNMQELVDEGYLRKVPECPSGGVYAWTSAIAEDTDLQSVVGCSVHSAGVSSPVVEPPAVEPPAEEPEEDEKDKDKDKDKGKGKDKGKDKD